MGKVYPVKYYITTILTILLLSSVSFSQSLKVVDTKTSEAGLVGHDVKTSLNVQNISEEAVYFRIYELKKQIGSSQTNLICIGEYCLTGNDALPKQSIRETVRKVEPGMIDNAIQLVLESGLISGVSTVTYRIENIEDTADYTDIEIHYEINELSDEGLLYSSKNVDLSDVYPNPVTEIAIFDYRIKDDSKEAKVIIHNVLGTVAGEYQLNPYEMQLKVSVENFNPGVYFYSLYIDNEGVATKKLVVRK